MKRLLLVLAACLCGAVQAQPYPNRPIKFVVPFPPGGNLDALASGGGPGCPSRPDRDASRTASRDDLDPDSARVLDALPARGGAGTSTIAVEAGVDLDTVLRCLGRLAGYGFIERCDRGWRLRRT